MQKTPEELKELKCLYFLTPPFVEKNVVTSV